MDGDKSVTVSFTNSCDGNTGIGCGRPEDEDGPAAPRRRTDPATG